MQLALVSLVVAHGNGVIAGCFLAGGVGLLAEVVFYDGHGCKRLTLHVLSQSRR